ncbi:MAG: hypothetical protein ACK5CL_03225 [Sphingomonadales bacterium]
MRRVVVALVLPILLIFSCEPCGKGHNPKRKISDFSITASDSFGTMLGNDTVFTQDDTAFFRMQFEVITVATTSPSFEFISSATACSPVEPYLIFTIDSMAVITVDAWDAGHPAMSDISDFVTAKNQWGYSGQVDTTFYRYTRTIKNDRMFYYSPSWFGIHKLPVSRKGRFYVWLRLSNGAELKSNVLNLVE